MLLNKGLGKTFLDSLTKVHLKIKHQYTDVYLYAMEICYLYVLY